ncbi:MAG: hypothetical protein ACLGI8_02995 [Acidimicrobiia bacterium]
MTEPTSAPRPLLQQLGPRALRRAEPRASIAVAGAGCALAVLGVLIISGDTGLGDSGELNRWPGVILSAAVVVAGYVVMSQVDRGAIATGGAVAAALGVPPLMFFLTFDQEGLPPYSTEGILGVSTLAWLGTYVLGPAKGRPFFLGAGLIGLWATVLQVTEDLFDLPWTFFGGWFSYTPTYDEDGFPIDPSSTFDAPDPTTLGMLTLVLGVAYLVIARVLDGSGRHGTATPFAMATIPLFIAAPIFLADELQEAGTGLLLIALGLALAVSGAASGRRATTWLGGAAVGLGAAVFLTDMTEDPTVGGMLFLAAGIGLVFAAHGYAAARDEPDEMLVTGAPMAGIGGLTPAWTAAPVAPVAEAGLGGAAGVATSAPPPPDASGDDAADRSTEPPTASPPADDEQWAPPASDDDEPPLPPPPAPPF